MRAATWRHLAGAIVLAFVVTVVGGAPTASAASSASVASSTTYPTWAQVQAARSSEAATLKQIAAIKALLAKLQADLTAAQADEDAKGEAYGNAQDAYDTQVLVTAGLQGQADAAKVKADAAQKQASRLIGSLGRVGSGDLTIELF